MTVIRPNSISGINSITGQGGDVTIFRADGTVADVTVNNITSGIITGTHYGSGANLTNLPAGNLTGTLPAISAANLTSLPAANLTGTVADARLTSVSSSKLSGALPALDGSALTGVGASFGNSSVNTSGIITATTFVPTQGQLSHRNIAINGDMTIAQRGTSSNSTAGYHTVDRWEQNHGSTDEAPTFTTFGIGAPSSPYHLPTTGPHPYKEGFRTGWGLINGNQTSGGGADDNIIMGYAFEAQDIVNSGWDYTNPNSYITLSFWIKSSVSQEFFGQMLTQDGTIYNYPFGTGALTAFTWKKVVKTIPGNANITFNNDNGSGWRFYLWPYAGSNLTGSVTNDAWMVNNWSTRVYNSTSTWYTTNDASLQITGFQLEVGPVATPFEHISYQENFRRCCRYYWKSEVNSGWGYGGYQYAGSYRMTEVRYPVAMRATPTSTVSINHGGTGFAISKEQYKAWTNKSYSSGDNVHTTSAVFDAEL